MGSITTGPRTNLANREPPRSRIARQSRTYRRWAMVLGRDAALHMSRILQKNVMPAPLRDLGPCFVSPLAAFWRDIAGM